MKLFRYELFCDDEPQDVGFLVGLDDLGLSCEKAEELLEPFDTMLEIPDMAVMRDSLSFFTEKGNERFQADIFCVAMAYQDSMFDVKLCSLELPEELLDQVVYQDVYQVCIPRRVCCEELNYLVSREDFPSKEYLKCLNGPFRVYPPTMIGDIFHVGTMDIAKKSKHSHEGNGLSISNCPDAWVSITDGHTHGDYFRLYKPDLRLLDYYGVTDDEWKIMQDWAEECGYVVEGTLYKSISWGEDGEEYFSLFQTYDDALYEADDEEDRVVAVPGLLPTAKLLEQSLVKVELLQVKDIVAELYAEQVLGYDGVYWDEELEIGAYSAPRGVIFNSKLDGFQVVNMTMKREKYGMSKDMSLKARIEKLKVAAREMGGELLVDEGDFHSENHLHCLWYDSGQIGAFVYKGYTCSVEVVGDVNLGVLDKEYDECILEYRKPANGGAYGVPEVMSVIKDDKTLKKLMDDGRIDFSLQNWVELRVFDEDDEEIEDVVFCGMLDGILDDDVLDAMGRLDDFVRVIENILKEKEEEMDFVDELLADAGVRAGASNGGMLMEEPVKG